MQKSLKVFQAPGRAGAKVTESTFIYPASAARNTKKSPLAPGSMKSYQATVFIEASKRYWGIRSHLSIVPTGMVGCSKKTAKNASDVR